MADAPAEKAAYSPVRQLVPLRWVEGRYGSHYATVGKITRTVAVVSWSTVRGDPQPYIVRVALPGIDGAQRQANSLDEAKAIAGAMVNKWLRDALDSAQAETSTNGRTDDRG